ncbi:hypothetical protein D3C81_2202420 [compost metagenome]
MEMLLHPPQVHQEIDMTNQQQPNQHDQKPGQKQQDQSNPQKPGQQTDQQKQDQQKKQM